MGVNLERKPGVNLMRKPGGQFAAEIGGQFERIFHTDAKLAILALLTETLSGRRVFLVFDSI